MHSQIDSHLGDMPPSGLANFPQADGAVQTKQPIKNNDTPIAQTEQYPGNNFFLGSRKNENKNGPKQKVFDIKYKSPHHRLVLLLERRRDDAFEALNKKHVPLRLYRRVKNATVLVLEGKQTWY